MINYNLYKDEFNKYLHTFINEINKNVNIKYNIGINDIKIYFDSYERLNDNRVVEDTFIELFCVLNKINFMEVYNAKLNQKEVVKDFMLKLYKKYINDCKEKKL